MLFKGGRETVFRGRASYVVVAVLVGAFVLLLAAPAWSKDDRTRKEDSGAGETKTQGSSAQTDKKASGSKRAGSSTQERNQASGKNKKNNAQGSGKGPLAGAKVKVEKDGGTQNVVDDGDVLVISGNYEIEPGASVTIEDKDGTQGTFDKQNAKIKVGSVKIEVEKDPIEATASEELSTDELEVVASDGIETQAKKNKRKGRGKGRGGRAGRNNCDIIIDQVGTGPSQYNNIDEVIQQCRVGGGGRGGRGGENIDIEFEEEIEITEEGISEETEEETIEERSADDPDGAVADTSTLDTLPNTGGPSLLASALASALVPAMALLTAGAGFSVWRFGSRRRRDDD